jgi:hypothetical protein
MFVFVLLRNVLCDLMAAAVRGAAVAVAARSPRRSSILC